MTDPTILQRCKRERSKTRSLANLETLDDDNENNEYSTDDVAPTVTKPVHELAVITRRVPNAFVLVLSSLSWKAFTQIVANVGDYKRVGSDGVSVEVDHDVFPGDGVDRTVDTIS
jgi:hypothetical protein